MDIDIPILSDLTLTGVISSIAVNFADARAIRDESPVPLAGPA